MHGSRSMKANHFRGTMRRLPVVFHPLDLECKTKPVPALVCPVRGDVMTAGGCGRCRDFRSIEFDEHSRPVLVCSAHRGERRPSECVQDLLRVPLVCTAADTKLALIVPHLRLGALHDAIPVLDLQARPIGVVSLRELERLVDAGIPLDTMMCEVMSRLFVCVPPDAELEYASELLSQTQAAQLFAVAADGTFLGLLSHAEIRATVCSN